MRNGLPIILLLLTCLACLAQQQEKGLMDRLTNPDRTRGNELQKKQFNGGGTLDLSRKAVGNTTIYTDQKMQTDGYTTRSFFGIKNPWFGTKIYQAKKADFWSKSVVANADRKYGVETVKVEDFEKSGRKANLGNSITLTPQFTPKSGTPGAMDQINDQLKKKNMTIEQVRELLNKN